MVSCVGIGIGMACVNAKHPYKLRRRQEVFRQLQPVKEQVGLVLARFTWDQFLELFKDAYIGCVYETPIVILWTAYAETLFRDDPSTPIARGIVQWLATYCFRTAAVQPSGEVEVDLKDVAADCWSQIEAVCAGRGVPECPFTEEFRRCEAVSRAAVEGASVATEIWDEVVCRQVCFSLKIAFDDVWKCAEEMVSAGVGLYELAEQFQQGIPAVVFEAALACSSISGSSTEDVLPFGWSEIRAYPLGIPEPWVLILRLYGCTVPVSCVETKTDLHKADGSMARQHLAVISANVTRPAVTTLWGAVANSELMFVALVLAAVRSVAAC
jgi:hypothetical protein